ncbi:MAG TPA: DUF2254 family protein [Microthrixaceae bacterium]|nr:DUF2254 family protein [Microthrixaceae bacterium]
MASACWSTSRFGRSQSRPFLDPTTAVQAIDRLHDGLLHLANRSFSDGVYRDEGGCVRLVVPVMEWEDYVLLCFEEIRLAGAASPQVARRLTAALQDLIVIAPPERQEVLRRQLTLLQDAARDAALPGADVELNLQPDRLGLGVQASDDEVPLGTRT